MDQTGTSNIPMDVSLIEQELEVEFNENLLAFQDTVPRYMKNKKARRQKKKTKKDGEYMYIYYVLLMIISFYIYKNTCIFRMRTERNFNQR